MGLEVGRLNGDKRPDVLAATEDGTISPYLTRANGTMRVSDTVAAGSADSYSPLALGQFVGGPALDAIVADYPSDSLTLLRGDGQGGFALTLAAPPPEIPGAWGIASGNLNGRGGLDLAVNLYDDQQVQVLRGSADGLKAGPKYDLSDDPETIAVGRVGRDRGSDIVVGTDTSVDIFINKP
jgi:hypothetical protein